MRQFERAFVGEPVAAETGSVGLENRYTVAGVAVAVRSPAAGPGSQYTAVGVGRRRSQWAEASIRPGSLQVAVGIAAAAAVAGHTAAAQVGRCCRPLSRSWTQRTWRATWIADEAKECGCAHAGREGELHDECAQAVVVKV